VHDLYIVAISDFHPQPSFQPTSIAKFAPRGAAVLLPGGARYIQHAPASTPVNLPTHTTPLPTGLISISARARQAAQDNFAWRPAQLQMPTSNRRANVSDMNSSFSYFALPYPLLF
jgi:hypothetical protein